MSEAETTEWPPFWHPLEFGAEWAKDSPPLMNSSRETEQTGNADFAPEEPGHDPEFNN